jgi:quercetin dioxygenase-like cupin family protein
MEASSGKVVRIGALELRFLVDETQGAGDLVMFEFVVPAEARVPAPHFHRDVDEAVYGLEGTLTTTVDGRKHEVRRGDAVLIPRGSVHHHENLHAEAARALIVLTPGSIGRRYFEEMAEEVNVPGKPDPARVKEVMLRHGLVPA